MAARRRGSALIFGSLFAAIVASGVLYSVILSMQQQVVIAQRPEETVSVVVAKNELIPGITITEEDVELRSLPAYFVPDEAMRQLTDAIGRVPRERVLGGEYIRTERLAEPEAGTGLTAIIPRGMRAQQLALKGSAAVSGLLNPGNYVDVIAVLSTDSKSAAKQAFTILEAVSVLAVNDRLENQHVKGKKEDAKSKKPPPSNGTVTLAVSPADAERLAHAAKTGKLLLALRNDVDVTLVKQHGRPVEAPIGRSAQTRIPASGWKQNTQVDEVGRLRLIKGKTSTETVVGPNGTIQSGGKR
jgi:pilus assembly protein CpaB